MALVSYAYFSSLLLLFLFLFKISFSSKTAFSLKLTLSLPHWYLTPSGSGHFDRMQAASRCLLFWTMIWNNVNRDHIWFGLWDFQMPIVWDGDLVSCHFPAPADPVIKSAYCDTVFTAPVGICHAALAAFIDKPELFFHRNTGFASIGHDLSSIIVLK